MSGLRVFQALPKCTASGIGDRVELGWIRGEQAEPAIQWVTRRSLVTRRLKGLRGTKGCSSCDPSVLIVFNFIDREKAAAENWHLTGRKCIAPPQTI
jgi:hypothetical protein